MIGKLLEPGFFEIEKLPGVVDYFGAESTELSVLEHPGPLCLDYRYPQADVVPTLVVEIIRGLPWFLSSDQTVPPYPFDD